MAFRLLSPVPFSFFQTLVYLRRRRLNPLAIAHAFLDGANVMTAILLSLDEDVRVGRRIGA